jgi:putative IMPACT (imprinted ancient) family translation regulator
VGGLVTAYKAAAEEALNRAQIVEQQVSVTLVFELAYEVTPAIMKLVKDFDLRIISQEYGETCSLTAEVPLLLKNNLLERIRLLNMTGTVFTVSLRE